MARLRARRPARRWHVVERRDLHGAGNGREDRLDLGPRAVVSSCGSAPAAAPRRARIGDLGDDHPGEHERAPHGSPRSQPLAEEEAPPSAAKTLSRVRRMAACAGGALRWATTWSVKAMPDGQEATVEDRDRAGGEHSGQRWAAPRAAPAAALGQQQTANWTQASRTGRSGGTASRPPGRAPPRRGPRARTRRSPRSMVRVSVTLRRKRPTTQRTAPIQALQPARWPQRRPTMRNEHDVKTGDEPAFPAVVETRPTCWSEAPKNRTAPAMRPAARQGKARDGAESAAAAAPGRGPGGREERRAGGATATPGRSARRCT